jgi:hypothetical protein
MESGVGESVGSLVGFGIDSFVGSGVGSGVVIANLTHLVDSVALPLLSPYTIVLDPLAQILNAFSKMTMDLALLVQFSMDLLLLLLLLLLLIASLVEFSTSVTTGSVNSLVVDELLLGTAIEMQHSLERGGSNTTGGSNTALNVADSMTIDFVVLSPVNNSDT